MTKVVHLYASQRVSRKAKDGKDAVNINLSPSELVYNADKDGNISSTQFNNNSSTVSATRGGKAVSCSTSIVSKDNCEANIIRSNVIKITKITTESVGTGKYVPSSAGGVKLKVTVDGTDYYSYLPFRVNTNTFVKTVLETDESFQRKYTEISNKYDAVSSELNNKADLKTVESTIEQTAKNIKLEVLSKTSGRRNMLVNSAFRNQDSVFIHSLAHIEKNTGVDGVNCIHSSDQYSGTGDGNYIGAFWDSTQKNGVVTNIPIVKGKTYVLSCWIKSDNLDLPFNIECLYMKSINQQSRADANGAISVSFKVHEKNKWEKISCVLNTNNADATEYLAVNFWSNNKNVPKPIGADEYPTCHAYICKPMMEEGDTYKGWSRSQQDYDYVGGNMIDNARTLEVGGSLKSLNPNGLPDYGRAYYGDCMALRIKNTNANNTYGVMEFATDSMELDVDYIFSFLAKGRANIGLYAQCDRNAEGDSVFSEDSVNQGTRLLNFRYASIIEIPNQLTKEYRRYWGHMRFHGYLPSKLYIQLNGAGEVYVCQPKLEIGATMTEFTERKTDLVDKASLKAAGINITSDMVELYGNQVKVSGAKGGTPVAMFENGMLNSNLINADKIMAKQLETTGSNGQSVSIENGLMKVYGTNGRCNIEFGVNSNGEAILSYYDKDGKWLYDLGPNKLDGGQLTESTLNGDKYVNAASFFGTNNFFSIKTYMNVDVKQVNREYSRMLFGNNLFGNDDQEVANNNAAHIGYKPFEKLDTSDVTTLYRYTAPRQSGTIIKDEVYGLTTPALARQADGKYFTNNSILARNGQLTNLAPAGYYFRQSEQVRMAPHPMPSAGTQPVKFPAYSISWLNITSNSTGTVMSGYNAMMSYLMRTIKIQN